MPGVIRSSELRWTLAALNTPLQLSDVSHEMGQTFQMRKQLRLISHYKCCLLWVSGFSSAAHGCVWPDCVGGKELCQKHFPKTQRDTQTWDAECSTSLAANSLSAMLKIFPIMGAERQSQWRLLLKVAKCHECCPHSQERHQTKPSISLDGSLSLDFWKAPSALKLNYNYYYYLLFIIFLSIK